MLFAVPSAPLGSLAAALTAVLCFACGAEAPRQAEAPAGEPLSLVADLVERFQLAALDVDTPLIRLGTDASHAYLESGWSFDEVGDVGNPFAWSIGESSRIRFYVGVVRPATLRFRCYPFPAASGPPQKLSVVLNGRFLDMISLEPRNIDYELELPPDALTPGDNQLEFYYAITYDPSQEIPGVVDKRMLGVLWHWIRIGGIGEDHTLPSVEPAQRTLSIPLFHRVRYLVRTPAGASLRIDDLEAPTGGGLRVTATLPDGELHELGLVRAGSTGARLSLPSRAADFVELGLEAVALGDAVDAPVGHVVVRGPVVEAPIRGAAPAARRPNIVLYVIDTLRRDQLGLHGAEGPVSPSIDALAREASVFEDARAVSSWTRPAAATLLTGLLPRSHGVTTTSSKLASEAVTLAEVLRAVGYQTAAFSINVNVSSHFGFDQGFGQFDDLIREFNLKILHEAHEEDSAHAKTDIVHEKGFEYLLGGEIRQPFFVYFHTMDPHAPYNPNSEFQAASSLPEVDPGLGTLQSLADVQEGKREASDAMLSQIRSLYAGEVARNDRMFGSLVSELRRLGLYEDALIIVVSDHGEGFLEHGFMGHANTLYDESQRIPLIVKLPGSADGDGRRVRTPVHQTDLMPSLLGYLGIELREPVDGRDLRGIFEGGEAFLERARVAHLDMPPFQVESVVSGPLKLIIRTDPRDAEQIAELYDLEKDPDERYDLSADRRADVARLSEILAAGSAEPRWSVPIEPLGEVEDRLRALGYVE